MTDDTFNLTPESLPTVSHPLVVSVTDRSSDESHQQRTFEIEKPRCIVGSGEAADVQIESDDLQKSHCEIVRNPAGVYVREIARGLTVNGIPLNEAWVYQGDTLSVGNVELTIEAIGQLLLKADIDYSTVVRETTQLAEETKQDAEAWKSAEEKVEPQSEVVAQKPCGDCDNDQCSKDFCQKEAVQAQAAQAQAVQTEVAQANVEAAQPEQTTNEDVESSFHTDFVIPAIEDESEDFQQFASCDTVHDVKDLISRPSEDVEDTFGLHEQEEQDDTQPVSPDEISRSFKQHESPTSTHEPASPHAEDNAKVEKPNESAAPLPNPIADALARLELADAQEAEQPPHEAPAGSVWDTDSTTNTNWLEELYGTAIPAESEAQPAAESSNEEEKPQEPQGWQPDQLAAQLLKPNSDPSQFTDLPESTAQQANDVLSQVEEIVRRNEESAEVAAADKLLINVESEDADPQPVDHFHQEVDVVNEPVNEAGFESTEDENFVVESEVEAEKPEVVGESVAEVLARMRASGQLDQDVADDDEDDFDPPNPVAEQAAAAPIAGSTEDSVQDYMNQLMNRLRGDDANAEEVSPEVGDEPEPVVESEKDENEDLTPKNPMSESEFQPNFVPREKSSTLDALRQIANQSVDSAIKASTKEKNAQTSLIYLAGTGGCLFLSAVLFIMSRGVLDIAFILAAMFAVGCVAMGFMFVSINASTGKTDVDRSKRKSSGNDDDETPKNK